MNHLQALVFDAYGTLFDVRSVLARCEKVFPGHGAAITSLWRTKQLEYTWLRSLMGTYRDFWGVTEDSLRYTCLSLGLTPNEEQISHLMESYLTLSPFADTGAALEALQGMPKLILSNGSPAMLQAAVNNAGLADRLDGILSVDEVGIYKPHPSVYQLAVDRLGLAREHIGFVSSNGWDVAGAKAFGFQVFWLNRTGAPVEELGVQPDAIISSPLELARFR